MPTEIEILDRDNSRLMRTRQPNLAGDENQQEYLYGLAASRFERSLLAFRRVQESVPGYDNQIFAYTPDIAEGKPFITRQEMLVGAFTIAQTLHGDLMAQGEEGSQEASRIIDSVKRKILEEKNDREIGEDEDQPDREDF